MKYFCVSDIHGFYDQLLSALNNAGFDRNNPDHTLISCGDHFDRGRQPMEVLDYLMNLPRKILIRGNHEDLLTDCCARGWFHPYDESNGTLHTVQDLSAEYAAQYKVEKGDYPRAKERCVVTFQLLQPFFSQLELYYETENYIFVHAWIPVQVHDSAPFHHLRGRKFSAHPAWREATEEEWEQARWLNPFTMAKLRLQAEKTIVCGHWHCSAGWASAEGRSEFGEDALFDIYEGDGFIAIDRCTAHTGKVNVLVIEDEPMN